MSDPALLKHYCNLLITLSRDYVTMKQHAKELRHAADNESFSAGKKSGLYCQAKTISKQADKLKFRITKSRITLEHLFKTSNVVTISQQSLR